MRIASIVEGHGEVEALPVLLRRICSILVEDDYPEILRPLRRPRSKLLKEGELEKAVRFLMPRTGPGDAILILLDADDACPAELAPKLRHRVESERQERRILVVLAKCEYEAWFLAAADSLKGLRGLDEACTSPDNPEDIRNAKGWLSRQMLGNQSYRETIDQPALSARFDLDQARSAHSFDKLWRDIARLFQD